jgi:hypothetical protein
VGSRGGHSGTEGVTTFVLLSLLAVVVWIVRSVMHPGIGGPDKKKPDRWTRPPNPSASEAIERARVSIEEALRGARDPVASVPRPVTSAPRPATPPNSAPRNTGGQRAATTSASRASAGSKGSMGASSAGDSKIGTGSANKPVSHRADRASNAAPVRRASTTREDPPEWYVLLDVSRDAPRTEVLSAVKRRIERARIAGDTPAIAHILRAAEAGLGSRGVRDLARKLGPRP